MSDELTKNEEEILSDDGGFADLAKKLAEFQQTTKFPDEIQFPIEVASVRLGGAALKSPEKVGAWAGVRPAKDSKTYLGIFLGALPNLGMTMYYYKTDSKELNVTVRGNPAIFVPALGRIVWGVESWWAIIERPEDMKMITDTDIADVWYVKALADLQNASVAVENASVTLTPKEQEAGA